MNKDTFENMHNDHLYVPELKDIAALGNGNVTTRESFPELLLYRGDTGASELENFGVDLRTWDGIFKKYLPAKHHIAAQNIWNMIKGTTLFDLGADMTEKMTGVRPRQGHGNAN